MAKTPDRRRHEAASLQSLPSVPEIEAMDRAALVALWPQVMGSPVPRSMSQPLLRRFIAWELQVRGHGGLSARELEQLVKLGTARARRKSPQMANGTRYLREWNGVTHVVEKVTGGYLWDGRIHASLTAIAGAITGAHWSGPRFFGVTRSGRLPGPRAAKGGAQ
jgi:hypothetical protein